MKYITCKTLVTCLLISMMALTSLEAQIKIPNRGFGINVKPSVNNLPNSSKRYALVIGIDKYQDPKISSLSGASNDANALADALYKYAGFPKNQIILLTNEQPPNRRPTKANIRRYLSNLLQTVPKDGLFLLSFAGHGIERNGQAFLLPSDAQVNSDIGLLEYTSLLIERVRDLIKLSGIQQVVILLDSCRNNPEAGRSLGDQPLTEAYTKGFSFDQKNSQITAFAVLYATAKGQRAYEYSDKKQGYFSWALVEGLKGNAKDDKGEVTLSSLVKYIQDVVPKRVSVDLGKLQTPFANIEGYKSDELVLAFFPKSTPQPRASAEVPKPTPTPETESSIGTRLANSGVEKFNNGDFDGAISNFNSAIEFDPKNTEDYRKSLSTIYLKRATSKYQQANFEGAIADTNKAIEISPIPLANAYNMLGVLRHQLKQFDEAILAFSKGMEINPNLAILYANRGDSYKAKGKKNEAKADFDKARQLDSTIYTPNSNPNKNPEIVAKVRDFILSGNSKVLVGSYDGAIRDFTNAINLNPENPAAIHLRANTKVLNGFFMGYLFDNQIAFSKGKLNISNEYKELKNQIDNQIKNSPNNSTLLMYRSMFNFSSYNCFDAKKDIEKAVNIDPQNYLAYLVLAYIRPISEYDQSIKDINKAIALNSKSSAGYFIQFLFSEFGRDDSKRKKAESEKYWENAMKYASEEETYFLTLYLKRKSASDFDFGNTLRCG